MKAVNISTGSRSERLAGIAGLKALYRSKRREIADRLGDFREILDGDERTVFAELAYCICTASAKAASADAAIRRLAATGILYKGRARQIGPYLRGVRFWRKKSVFIESARRSFTERGRIVIKKRLIKRDPVILRDELVWTAKGLGYKEASHFLRNVGLGEELAILDRHTLRCLNDFGVIEEMPGSLTRRRYLSIEEKMRAFSRMVHIPMGHLDLLLWSRQTGRIFK